MVKVLYTTLSLTGHCLFFLYMGLSRTSVLLPSISFLHSIVWQRHTEKDFSIESYNCTWNCSITHSQTMSSWPSIRRVPTARVVSSTHFPVRFHVYLFYQTPRRHFHHPYLDQTIRRLTTPFSVLHFGTKLHGVTLLCTCAPPPHALHDDGHSHTFLTTLALRL